MSREGEACSFFLAKARSRVRVLLCAGVAHVQGQNSCSQEVRTAVSVWSYFRLCNTFHETVAASPCGHAFFGLFPRRRSLILQQILSTRCSCLFIISHKFEHGFPFTRRSVFCHCLWFKLSLEHMLTV